MAYLKEHGTITRTTCVDVLGVSKDTALRELTALLSRGLIQRQGVGRGIYYVLS